jgi:sulfoxide reductase heme-binding subunit YedZ
MQGWIYKPITKPVQLSLWSRIVSFPWLRIVVHLGAWLPVLLLGWDALRDNLTANPIQEATFRTGKTALVLLLLSLACTPANTVLGLRAALKVRRTLGLYAFGYVALHFYIFIGVDYGFRFDWIWQELSEKRYVLVGFAAGLILLTLAITSFQWWMRRMGKRWKRLHRLVYLAGLLAVFHYIWLVKADIRTPLMFGAVLAGLLALRLPVVKRAIASIKRRLQ